MSDDVLRGLRKRILEVAAKAGEGHVPSALSILEMVWMLYDRVLTSSDIFVLSKGHACLALYAALEKIGSPINLDRFCETPDDLLGHPERHKGSICTTGSLGHGFPMAVGMALAKRIKNEPGRIFCIVGDGELEEGACWEATIIAARHRLANLTILVDANATSPNQIDGEPFASDLPSKFRAFGWRTCRISGHDIRMIERMAQFAGGASPIVIICDTIKGHGVVDMELDPQAWHHKAPTADMAFVYP